MARGIETAASAMVGIMALNDTLANNLANVNTPGFKQSNVTFKSVQDVILNKSVVSKGNENNNNTTPLGVISLGSTVDSTSVDFRQGGIKVTSNPLDLAIDGKGFFEIKTPNGTAYTRDGSFKRLSDGRIATIDGNILQCVTLPDKKTEDLVLKDTEIEKLKINTDGNIDIDGQINSKIKIVQFKDVYKLTPVGNSIFMFNDPTNNPQNKPVLGKGFELTQRTLEASNANVVETMVNSITGMRTYESLARVIDANKNTLGKAVNEVGRLK
ncbi:MAG: flagellar hook-basal body protein [Candidatus Gastranaerophilales bacterium]|nr:flagellar hook-basal body protein [Candidatus Gastranaerophilales bacterium]